MNKISTDMSLAELSSLALRNKSAVPVKNIKKGIVIMPKKQFKKPKNLLTIISIAIGVFSVVLISAIGQIGTNKVTGTLLSMGLNSMLVQPDVRSTLNKQDMDVIRRVSGVKKAMPLMTATTQLSIIRRTEQCMAWGVSSDARQIISLQAAHGRLISDSDVSERRRVCVIDEKIAVSAYGRSNIVGKNIKLLVGGSYYDFEIVGVAQSGISALQSALSGIIPDFVYVPYTVMQDMAGRSGYDKIAVLLNTGDSETAAKTIVSDLERKNAREGVTVMNLLQQRRGLEDMLHTVTLVLSLIAGISLIVSGLSVMTAMLVTVNERRREIGIKKSIGASNAHIMREFLSESVSLAAFGAVLGVSGGIAAALTGCLIFDIAFAFDVTATACAAAAALIMGGLFGVYPAVKAANMPPIEALR